MSRQILTEVSATVDADRQTFLVTEFRAMTAGGAPDGLVRTELLRGANGQWRVHTLWRDRAALDAMRARPEAPAAPQLFIDAGAEPSLLVWELEHCFSAVD